MIEKQGLPSKGDLVICTVKRVLPHCAFVSLDEFKSKEGMLHISEVSLKGVKDIRDHLSVNKQFVCKVIGVHDAKGEVDLSLKRVKPQEMSKKLNEARLEKRLYKMIEYSCKKAGVDCNKVLKSFIDDYGSLVEFYDELKSEGLVVIESLKLPSNVSAELKKQLSELLEQMKVSITKTVSLSCDEGDGLLRIKSLLTGFNKTTDYELSIKYLSAPKYLFTLEARNYKFAEQSFEKLFNEMQLKGKQLGVKVGLIG